MRGIIDFWHKRRRRARVTLESRREVGTRRNAPRGWISKDAELAALAAISDALGRQGIPAEKIRRDEVLKDVLKALPDEDDVIELQMDIEEALQIKVDPELFQREFLQLRFDNAVAWLASRACGIETLAQD